MFRKILQPFYTAYVIVTFVVSVLAAFPVFVILAVINNFVARKIIFSIVRYWSLAWLWLIGMPVKLQGRPPAQARYIVVANHISYLDTLVLFSVVQGYFRALGKKEISRIPVIGLIYTQLAIMVDRSSHHSRAMSMRMMGHVLKNEGSIVIFPEGTFNETAGALKDFYDGAFRLAINTQTDILPVIFPDTVHRWHYSAWWKLWPGGNRAIYLEPVPVAGLTIKSLPALKRQVYELMENAIVRLA